MVVRTPGHGRCRRHRREPEPHRGHDGREGAEVGRPPQRPDRGDRVLVAGDVPLPPALTGGAAGADPVEEQRARSGRRRWRRAVPTARCAARDTSRRPIRVRGAEREVRRQRACAQPPAPSPLVRPQPHRHHVHRVERVGLDTRSATSSRGASRTRSPSARSTITSVNEPSGEVRHRPTTIRVPSVVPNPAMCPSNVMRRGAVPVGLVIRHVSLAPGPPAAGGTDRCRRATAPSPCGASSTRRTSSEEDRLRRRDRRLEHRQPGRGDAPRGVRALPGRLVPPRTVPGPVGEAVPRRAAGGRARRAIARTRAAHRRPGRTAPRSGARARVRARAARRGTAA